MTIPPRERISTFDHASPLGLGFLTAQEVAVISGVSRLDSSTSDEYLAKIFREFKATFTIPTRVYTGDSWVYSDGTIHSYLEEAEKAIVKVIPPGTSEIKKEALIARKFFSILRQDLGKTDLPTQVGKLLETLNTEEHLQVINCVIGDTEVQRSTITRLTERLNSISSEFTKENIRVIIGSVVSGVYARASLEQIRATLGQEFIDFVTTVEFEGNAEKAEAFLSIFPMALIEQRATLEAGELEVATRGLLDVYKLKFSINHLTLKIEINNLPQKTPEEIRIKSERLQQWMLVDPISLNHIQSSRLEIVEKGFKTMLPGIFVFPNLIDLNLSKNQFRTVPPLPQRLQALNLSGNPLLRFGNLSALTALIDLDLSKTGLKRVPEEALSLPVLKFLTLSQNNLVTLPDGVIHLQGDFEGNPIIYLSPVVLAFIKPNQLGDVLKLLKELVYPAVSPLGKLYKQFVKPESEYSKEQISECLASLKEDDRNFIYEMVWRESGEPVTSDGSWGEHHAFDDLNVLARAVRRAILTKFERLPEDLRDTVYRRLYIFGGYPDNSYSDSIDSASLSRLADGMSFEIEATPQTSLYFTDLQSKFLLDAGTLCVELMKFKKDPARVDDVFSRPLSEVEVVERKIALKASWERFHSETKPAFEAEVSASEMICSPVIASALTQLQTEVPEFVFGSNEALQLELEQARIRMRTVQQADYTGVSFDVETQYVDATSPLANLFKLFVRGPFSPAMFEYHMSEISEEKQNSIYQQVWALSETRDATLVDAADQQAWGRLHALDNTRTLGLSVQAAIHAEYNALSQDDKNEVAGIIYDLAGRPATVGFEPWGEIHSLDSLSRLADAMYNLQVRRNQLLRAEDELRLLNFINNFFAHGLVLN